MSQRIEDTLSVLTWIKGHHGPGASVMELRIEATKRVARRRGGQRVTERTVFAHIAGKKPQRHTLQGS